MRLAVVFEDNGQDVVTTEAGPEVLPVYRWYLVSNTDRQWRLDLFAFLFATTKKFKFQQFRGLIAFGWMRPAKPFLELNLLGNIRLGG